MGQYLERQEEVGQKKHNTTKKDTTSEGTSTNDENDKSSKLPRIETI